MERIGIAASKMASGNLFFYNLYVVLLSFLFSLLIFFIAGTSIVLALIIIGYILKGILPDQSSQTWYEILRVCMVSLTIAVGFLNLYAILRNFRLNKDS